MWPSPVHCVWCLRERKLNARLSGHLKASYGGVVREQRERSDILYCQILFVLKRKEEGHPEKCRESRNIWSLT